MTKDNEDEENENQKEKNTILQKDDTKTQTSHLLRVSGLLIRIDMPHNIIRQSVNTIPCSLGHLCKSFCFGLVFERVGGEVDAGAVDVCFDEDVDTTDAVEWDLDVLVLAPVAHLGHVDTTGVVLFVAWVCLLVLSWGRRDEEATYLLPGRCLCQGWRLV